MSRADRVEALLVGAFLALLVLILLPAIHTPFRFDDTFNFEIRTGLFAAQHRDFGDYFSYNLRQLLETGRFAPLGLLLSSIYWIFSDAPTLYKLYLLLTTALAAGLVYRLLRRLGLPVAGGLLAVLLFAAFTQFHRYYHDPILGYIGITQLSVALLCAALLAWLKWDDGAGRRWLVISVVAWIACLSLYEANLPFLAPALVVVLARRRGWKPIGRGALTFALPALVFFLLVVRSRTGVGAGTGYQPSLELGALLETYMVTLAGPLPGSYALVDPDGLMGDFTAAELLAGGWRALVVGVLAAILTVHAARSARLTRRPLLVAAAFGVSLWLFSSALLALAPKYQGELNPGIYYLPGFSQVIGLAVAVAAATVGLVKWAGRRGAPGATLAAGAMGLILALIAGVTGTSNMRVVADEWPTAQTRSLLNDALRHGVIAGLPPGATVVGHGRDLNWYPVHFGIDKLSFDGVTFDRTGRKMDMRVDRYLEPASCPARADEWPRPQCAPVSRQGGWLSVQPIRGGGAAVLARSPAGRVRDPRATATALTAYVEGDLASGGLPLEGQTRDGTPWNADSVDWRVMRSGENWKLLRGRPKPGASLPLVSSLDLAGTNQDFVDPPPSPIRVRELGTRPLLP